MNYKLLLASNSPRRKELLAGLEYPFEVVALPDVDESYPPTLRGADVALFVARKKAEAYGRLLQPGTLLITADTVVICNDVIFGKPTDRNDACQMLHTLSGRTHTVATGVVLAALHKQVDFVVTTEVTFSPLTDKEINHYVDVYSPLDKAGAYGIQEWVGYVGIESIRGSYYNVMGLPVQRLYTELLRF